MEAAPSSDADLDKVVAEHEFAIFDTLDEQWIPGRCKHRQHRAVEDVRLLAPARPPRERRGGADRAVGVTGPLQNARASESHPLFGASSDVADVGITLSHAGIGNRSLALASRLGSRLQGEAEVVVSDSRVIVRGEIGH